MIRNIKRATEFSLDLPGRRLGVSITAQTGREISKRIKPVHCLQSYPYSLPEFQKLSDISEQFPE